MIHCISCEKYPTDEKAIPYGSTFPTNTYKVKLLSETKPYPLPTSGADVAELADNVQFAVGSELLVRSDEDGSTVYIYDGNGFKFLKDAEGASSGGADDTLFKQMIDRSITSVVIPDDITVIGNSAFCGCGLLESITIPDGVTTIGDSAFVSCTKLEEIIIPNTINKIGAGAFSGTCIESISIPSGITALPMQMCYGCENLTDVTIPNTVTSISSYAFMNCSALKTIVIPNSVNTFGGSIFNNCTSLESILLPNNLTGIPNYAFYQCTSLSAINLPNSIVGISSYAFASSGLTSIDIPSAVTSIGTYAFDGCSSLASITCRATTPPSLGSNAFRNVPASCPIYVPSSSVDAYKVATNWKARKDYIQAIVEE